MAAYLTSEYLEIMDQAAAAESTARLHDALAEVLTNDPYVTSEDRAVIDNFATCYISAVVELAAEEAAFLDEYARVRGRDPASLPWRLILGQSKQVGEL